MVIHATICTSSKLYWKFFGEMDFDCILLGQIGLMALLSVATGAFGRTDMVPIEIHTHLGWASR